MRLATFFLLAWSALCSGQEVLFQDTFNRADSRNIDATLTGITGSADLNLAADTIYAHGWLDPNALPPTYGVQDGSATNGGGVQILGNQLQLAVGAGTANAFVDRNFTYASILAAGGFSVSVDVAGFGQATSGQGGAIALGMSRAEAAATKDAFNGTTRMSGAFSADIGAVVPSQVTSDFWVALRGDNSLAWGGRTGTVAGVTGLAAKTGTISVNFAVTSFEAGTPVRYEVFLNGVSKGTGSFTWKATNQNYIGLDARDSSLVTFDNFTIATHAPTTTANLVTNPAVVPAAQTAQPVTLSWTTTGLPAGTTYQITADKAVSFPNGGQSGTIAGSTGTANALVNGTLGDTTFTISFSNATATVIATATSVVKQAAPLSTRPNVIVMLVDDMGWADLGCYGSEIPTPNIDALAADGLRFRQLYNGARCSPTRCSILTGLYPQQAAVDPSAPLPNLRTDNNVTFGELLKADGYHTYMAGKWHLGTGDRLPENRGFQQVWRFADGNANNTDQWTQSAYSLISPNGEIAFRDYTGTGKTFYQTDAIGDYALDFINHSNAKGDGAPFAMYLAFGAPHFSIEAPASLSDTYLPTYAQGWDVIRQARYDRQLATGVIDNRYPFPPRGGTGPHQAEGVVGIPAWNTLPADRQADLTHRMALYAAMIHKIDDNVGKVVSKLRETGQIDNTLIFFLSDNGANLEGGVFGNVGDAPLTGAALTNMGQPGQNDGIHYGGGWAHVSNTPLKLFKHFTHEGGTRAPNVIHWPAGFTARNTWVESPAHLVDVVATIVDVTGAPYPQTFNGHAVLPREGVSLVPAFNGQALSERPIFVEHESNRSLRKGRWKLVTENFTAFDNEFTANQKLLYDMDSDPGENRDVAVDQPGKVVELTDQWNAWSTRVGLPVGRLMTAPPANITPAPTAGDLFVDTFNRTAATDIDASPTGMWGSLVPPLGTGVTWFEGFEGSGTADSIQVLDNILQLATGVGMSENGLNHNFIDQEILNAGGFSVSVKVLGLYTDATDTANRYAGFGVGLTAAQASKGNDISGTSPAPIRGSATNPGAASCFVELDYDGNVKLWTGGTLAATVPAGKNTGTLTAAFKCSSFAAGATVTVSVYLDGVKIDLDPATSGTTRTFTWRQADSNYVALSGRSSTYVQVDNFAVRHLPLAYALASERALANGLQGSDSDLSANPDGDRLDNFGEWAFGTNPGRADDDVAATALVLAQPSSGIFKFAHRRLIDRAALGVAYTYLVSEDLVTWQEVTPVDETAIALPLSPGYEAATLSLPPEAVSGKSKVFLKIGAQPAPGS